MKPYDIVEYWHGHKDFGSIGPYDILDEEYAERVVEENLPEWDFIQFKLRNGQIIRVKSKGNKS